MPKISALKIQMVISKNIADHNFGVEMLAHELNISISYLREIVNDYFRMNPQRLIESIKMEKASQLLYQGLAIDVVRQKTGYTNSRTFRRVFKKKTHIPPSTFQKIVCNAKGKPVSLLPFIKQIWKV